MRFPPKPWGGAASNTPKVLGLLTFKAGGAEESDRKDRLGLIDIQMPVMNGPELAAAIREDERSTEAHQPLIAMTAHVMTGDREKCLDAGMDGYAPKPIRAADFSDAIGKLFPDAVRTPNVASSGV